MLLPSTKADMTFPRVDSDKLILFASFSRSPVAPVLACLSEPCKTKQTLLNLTVRKYENIPLN